MPNRPNAKKQKKQKGKGKQRQPRPSPLRFHVSKCGMDYGLALMDPFHPDARGACIPDMEAIPARRLTTYGRFSGVVGTNGFGYATFTPFNAVVSDAACVYTSIAGTVDTANSVFDAMTDSSFTSNSPLIVSNIGIDQVQYRLVGAGIRVLDTSPALTSSGIVCTVTCPTRDLNDTKFNDARRFVGTTVNRFARSTSQVNYYPSVPADMEYQSTASAANPIKCAVIVEASSSISPNLTFDGEFIAHFELVGFTTSKEPVHTDIQTYAIMRQQAGNVANDPTKTTKSKNSIYKDVKEAFDDVTGVAHDAKRAADAVSDAIVRGLRK
jgi:hypothetical protein